MKLQKTNSKIYKIDGVGVNFSSFHAVSQEEKSKLRTELGYDNKDFIITVVAELNKNKNQLMLVKCVPELKNVIPNLKILLIGKETLPLVRDFVLSENLNDTVKLLGYRNDVNKLTMISDLAFSASLREGLPVNIIEAMACGIPVVASDNRGHRSLIKNMETGFIFSPKSKKEMLDAIILLYKNPLFRRELGARSIEEAKKYSVDISVNSMAGIYKKVM
ncbi:glycosyltransferase [Treponema bryantii]|uniref:glycosyltransferase n=1 Tax=Treponema bryantii TaxID=163 RepID=UPI00041A92F5|nr:glycosyltransferase [Treponema bryantii]